MEVRIYH